MKTNYKHTLYASFTGYIVQAIVNNFAPLLFLTFQRTYQIPLGKITFLVTFNFGLQLLTDLVAAGFIDKIGYRISIVLAHGFSTAGLLGLAILPALLPDPFTGLILAVMIYAIGGGLLEVLVSPIVEACPTDHKEKAMSLLHSFYCWGHVGVVLISTLFFTLFGTRHWQFLAVFWALIPLCNGIWFTKVPISTLREDGKSGMSIRDLAKSRLFWVFMLLMFCAGASEQAVSQWASTFAEQGLSVSKTIGDLTGPMFFAIMMGLARLLYGKYGDRLPLHPFMVGSSLLCVGTYFLIALSPYPVFSLLGCGLCGFSVGIMWPGTFSLAALGLRGGGTAMFAFLALAGDLGCGAGPTLVGLVSEAMGDRLQLGILAGVIFPICLLGGLTLRKRMQKTPLC